MPDPAPFVLTPELLHAHRAGRVLCLDVGAVGAAHAPLASAPSGFRVLRPGSAAPLDGAPVSQEESSENFAAPPTLDSDQGEGSGSDLVRGPAVALVRVSGMLMAEPDKLCGFFDGYGGEDGIVARFCDAHASAYTAGVVLWVTSPGGDAVGCGEAAAAMRRAAAASGKPTVVCVDGRALSAAYWLAAAVGDTIVVSEGSDVGSIGCWVVHQDRSEANKIEGVAFTYIASRPGKVAGNPDAPLDEEGRARMQRSVDEIDQRFGRDVLAGRARVGAEFDQAAIDALNADARRGQAAVDAGLADLVGSLDQAIALCASRALTRLAAPPAPPPDAPPTPPPAPSPPGTSAMKISAAILAAAGVSDPISAEARVLSALALERDLLRETGQTDAQAAAGVLRAWKRDAAAVPELRTRLAASDADAEQAARVELLEQATTGRAPKLTEGEAFAWVVVEDASAADGIARADGKPIKRRVVAPAYAAPSQDADGNPIGFTLAGLRGHLRAKASIAAPELGGARSPAQPETVLSPDALAGVVIPIDQARALRARRPDIDPKKFAAHHAQIHGAPRAQESI
jgi:ClpP class serine protease